MVWCMSQMPFVPVIAHMELVGMGLDKGRCGDFEKTISQALPALCKLAHRQSGTQFDLGSPKQVGITLYQHLGLAADPKQPAPKPGKLPSTNAAALEWLLDKHPVVQTICYHRQLTTLSCKYTKPLLLQVKSDQHR
eukprot:SAG31_NODE_18246_length_642_cov_1.136280_2_plen_136_part_01